MHPFKKETDSSSPFSKFVGLLHSLAVNISINKLVHHIFGVYTYYIKKRNDSNYKQST